jgi:hypothetical protein
MKTTARILLILSTAALAGGLLLTPALSAPRGEGKGRQIAAADASTPKRGAAESKGPRAERAKGRPDAAAEAWGAKRGNDDVPRARSGQSDGPRGLMGPGAPHGARGPKGPGAPEGPLAGAGPLARLVETPFWTDEKLSAGLNLTADQIAALEASRAATIAALDEAPATEPAAIAQELRQESPDLDKVLALHDAAHAARAARMRAALSHFVAVKTILTNEQEQKLLENFRGAARERFPEASGRIDDIRGTVRQILQDGGTTEDVRAALKDEGVREQMIERIIKRLEEHRKSEK